MPEFPPLDTSGIQSGTGYLQPLVIIKPEAETRTNTAAVARDRDLIVPINPQAVMYWKSTLFFYGGAAAALGDVDVQWTTPAAPTSGGLLAEYLDIAAVNQNIVVPNVAVAYNVATYQIFSGVINYVFTARFEGMLVNGANGGYFSLNWAQNVVNAAPSTLMRGSRLECWFQ